MKIFVALLVAALFIFILKGFRLGLKRLLTIYPGLTFLNNLLTVIEISFFFVYVFWIADFLFGEKFYYEHLIYILLFIVIGFVGWFLIRDIIAGAIFRLRHKLETGSYIRVGEHSGKIIQQAFTYLKISTADDQTLRLPYSGIINEVITEMPYMGAKEEHILQIHASISIGITNAESYIRKAIFNTSWSNPKEEPIIRFINDTDKGYFYEVTLLSRNSRQMQFIKKGLEENPLLHIIS